MDDTQYWEKRFLLNVMIFHSIGIGETGLVRQVGKKGVETSGGRFGVWSFWGMDWVSCVKIASSKLMRVHCNS